MPLAKPNAANSESETLITMSFKTLQMANTSMSFGGRGVDILKTPGATQTGIFTEEFEWTVIQHAF